MQLSGTKIDRNLSAAQRNMLCDWLLERSAHPTGALVETGLRELGLWEAAAEPSAQSINEWMRRSLAFEIHRRALREANEVAGRLAGAGNANLDEANKTLLQNVIFEQLLQRREADGSGATEEGGPDFGDLANAIINLNRLRQIDRKLSQDERKLAILEKKAAALDAAAHDLKSPGGLTPETLRKIEEAAHLL